MAILARYRGRSRGAGMPTPHFDRLVPGKGMTILLLLGPTELPRQDGAAMVTGSNPQLRQRPGGTPVWTFQGQGRRVCSSEWTWPLC